MRYLVVLGALVGALAAASPASSGGWAAVGFAPLPDGTSAGETWSPTIFIRQHGVTPMTGLAPTVSIYRDDTGATESFTAVELEPGVYSADVVFSTEGDWRIAIDSGFAGSGVTYGPVEIGAPEVTGGVRELPVPGLGIAALGIAFLALLGGAAALLLTRRSRSLTPASG